MRAMPTPFPELLYLSLLAPFILRATAGIIFATVGFEQLKYRNEIASHLTPWLGNLAGTAVLTVAALEIFVAASLLPGYLTQVGALIGAVLAFKLALFKKRLGDLAPYSRAAYILLFAICLSLIVSGAGAYAIDYPL